MIVCVSRESHGMLATLELTTLDEATGAVRGGMLAAFLSPSSIL